MEKIIKLVMNFVAEILLIFIVALMFFGAAVVMPFYLLSTTVQDKIDGFVEYINNCSKKDKGFE